MITHEALDNDDTVSGIVATRMLAVDIIPDAINYQIATVAALESSHGWISA